MLLILSKLPYRYFSTEKIKKLFQEMHEKSKSCYSSVPSVVITFEQTLKYFFTSIFTRFTPSCKCCLQLLIHFKIGFFWDYLVSFSARLPLLRWAALCVESNAWLRIITSFWCQHLHTSPGRNPFRVFRGAQKIILQITSVMHKSNNDACGTLHILQVQSESRPQT